MRNDEVRKKISQSPQADSYKNYTFHLNFPSIKSSTTITGLSSLYVYVNQQIDGWDKMGDLPDISNSIDYFRAVKQTIINVINNYVSHNHGNIDAILAQTNQAIQNLSYSALPYNVSEIDFLKRIHSDLPNSYNAARELIFGTVSSYHFSSKDNIIGVIQAYEFLQKDNSDITERRNSEKKSLNTLRNDFINYIKEVETSTIDEIKNSQNKYQVHFEEINKIKSDLKNEIEEWFETSKTSYTSFYDTSNQNIQSLENTYEELMRLKKPADYWKERATDLKKEGDKFFRWLLIAVGFAIVTLYSLLWLTPEGMQKTFFNEDKSLAIRWSIIYITFISFLFFAIKAIMKSMFSAYHLSRDAEERHRLTYVYLAMIKDSAIEKEDRHLVMQSLFSRADTGLLKEDSSPSMPGAAGVIDIVKK